MGRGVEDATHSAERTLDRTASVLARLRGRSRKWVRLRDIADQQNPWGWRTSEKRIEERRVALKGLPYNTTIGSRRGHKRRGRPTSYKGSLAAAPSTSTRSLQSVGDFDTVQLSVKWTVVHRGNGSPNSHCCVRTAGLSQKGSFMPRPGRNKITQDTKESDNGHTQKRQR